MAHLIDKDALVSGIEKTIPSEPFPRTSETLYGAEVYGKREMCFKILDLIETLEVKEVDLEKEMDTYFETMEMLEHEYIFEDTFQRIAKHFFELGLRVNNEKEK